MQPAPQSDAPFELPIDIAGVRLTFVGTNKPILERVQETCRGFRCPDSAGAYRIHVSYETARTNRGVAIIPTMERQGPVTRFIGLGGGELILDYETRIGRMFCPSSDAASGNTSSFVSPETHLRLLVAAELAGSDGLLLHASAVEVNGNGVLFVGPSGAGKTTVSLLFPEHCVLNDESVAVRLPPRSIPTVAATPFSGEARRQRARRECPIGLVLLLEKAASTQITVIDRVAAFSALMRCVLLPCGDDELERRLFATTHRFLQACRVFRLSFAPDPVAVQAAVGQALQTLQ